jgi:hypothetical protein
MSTDPLEQIFVKTEQVEGEQRKILASLIFPFASVNPDTGEVHFKATADDLNAKQKILIFLLSRLALSTRPQTAFSAAASPKEIEKATGLPGGTVRPKLILLVNERIASKNGEGYLVPSANLFRAQKELASALNSEV